ncbi:hypothetical protein [Paenibacillus mucilaginosus]|uniref:hypothetical protein n=1 Tax=Paenibacillus mucilaginosus TaxID=61624 RepID=UPI003D1B31D6
MMIMKVKHILLILFFSLLLAGCGPNQLVGAVEDEALQVNVLATLQPDKITYKAEIAAANKTDRPIRLLNNCGSILWRDSFKNQSDTRACPAVESMGLEENGQETIIVPLSNEFIDQGYIKMKYEVEEKTSELVIKLEPKEEET